MYFAHKNKTKKETIDEHSESVLSYLSNEHLVISCNFLLDFLKSTGINKQEINMDKILQLNKKLLKDSLLFHDIGKQNHLFQKYKMDNDLNLAIDGNTYHSLKSALYFYDFEINNNFNTAFKNKLEYLLILCYTFVIAKHHSDLSNILDFSNPTGGSLKRFSQTELEQLKELPNNQININTLNQLMRSFTILFPKYSNIELFTFIRYIRGVLSYCDHSATFEFSNGSKYTLNRMSKDNINNSILKYKESIFEKSLNSDRNKLSDLMKIRVDFVKELDKNFIENPNCIEFLEAPTGAGKTHLSLRYSLKSLKENMKVIYSTQFNNVSLQTYQTYKDILDAPDGLKVNISNSVSEIEHFNSNNSEDNSKYIYDRSLFNFDLLEYNYSLISNARLLDILFGKTIKSSKAFVNLQNSIIIIDELQNISTELWLPLANILNSLVKNMNCRVLLMSATLPRISNIDKIELIQDRALIEHPIFRNRVIIKDDIYTKFENKNYKNDIYNIIEKNKGKRQLIMFNSKKQAIDYFNFLNNKNLSSELLLMTGNTGSKERKEIVNYIQEKENGTYKNKDVILISTQVIEAGLDIDMEIGYKDISLYDSEVQFLGRINRNNYFNKGIVYMFNSFYNSFMYENNRNIKLSSNYLQDIRDCKYDDYFSIIIENMEKSNSEFINNLKKGNFLDASKIVDIDKTSASVYVISNDESIKLYNQYIEYKSKINTINYSEYKIELRKIYSKMSEYIKTIYLSKKVKKSFNELGIVDYYNLNVLTNEQYNKLSI